MSLNTISEDDDESKAVNSLNENEENELIEKQWWPECYTWLQDLLGEPSTEIITQDGNLALWGILKDGLVLLQAINLIEPGIVPFYHVKSSKVFLHSLQERENVNMYIEACWVLGIPSNLIFMPSDLHQELNPLLVISNIIALSKIADKIGIAMSIAAEDLDSYEILFADVFKNYEDQTELSIRQFLQCTSSDGTSMPLSDNEEFQLTLCEMVKEVIDCIFVDDEEPDPSIVDNLAENAFAIDVVRRVYAYLLRQAVVNHSKQKNSKSLIRVPLKPELHRVLSDLTASLIHDLNLNVGGDYYTAKLLFNTSSYIYTHYEDNEEKSILLTNSLKFKNIWNNIPFWEEFYWDMVCSSELGILNMNKENIQNQNLKYNEDQRDLFISLLFRHVKYMTWFGEFDEQGSSSENQSEATISAVYTILEGISQHINVSDEEAELIFESVDGVLSKSENDDIHDEFEDIEEGTMMIGGVPVPLFNVKSLTILSSDSESSITDESINPEPTKPHSKNKNEDQLVAQLNEEIEERVKVEEELSKTQEALNSKIDTIKELEAELEDIYEQLLKNKDVQKKQEDQIKKLQSTITEQVIKTVAAAKEKTKKKKKKDGEKGKSSKEEDADSIDILRNQFKNKLSRLLNLIDKCETASRGGSHAVKFLNDTIQSLADNIINESRSTIKRLLTTTENEVDPNLEGLKAEFYELCEDSEDAIEFFLDAAQTLSKDPSNEEVILHILDVSKEAKTVLNDFAKHYDDTLLDIRSQKEKKSKEQLKLLSVLQSESETLKAENQSFNQKITTLQTSYDQLKSTHESMNRTLEEKEKAFKTMKSELEMIRQSESFLNQKLAALNQDGSTERSKLLSVISEKEQRISELHNEFESAKEKISKLELQVKSIAESDNEEKRVLNAQLTENAALIKNLQNESSSKAEKINELQSQVHKLQLKSEESYHSKQTNQEYEELLGENKKLKVTLKQKNKVVSEFKTFIQNMMLNEPNASESKLILSQMFLKIQEQEATIRKQKEQISNLKLHSVGHISEASEVVPSSSTLKLPPSVKPSNTSDLRRALKRTKTSDGRNSSFFKTGYSTDDLGSVEKSAYNNEVRNRLSMIAPALRDRASQRASLNFRKSMTFTKSLGDLSHIGEDEQQLLRSITQQQDSLSSSSPTSSSSSLNINQGKKSSRASLMLAISPSSGAAPLFPPRDSMAKRRQSRGPPPPPTASLFVPADISKLVKKEEGTTKSLQRTKTAPALKSISSSLEGTSASSSSSSINQNNTSNTTTAGSQGTTPPLIKKASSRNSLTLSGPTPNANLSQFFLNSPPTTPASAGPAPSAPSSSSPSAPSSNQFNSPSPAISSPTTSTLSSSNSSIWVCSSCQTKNPSNLPNCMLCSVKKTTLATSNKANTSSTPSSVPTTWICSTCKTTNPILSPNCSLCSAKKPANHPSGLKSSGSSNSIPNVATSMIQKDFPSSESSSLAALISPRQNRSSPVKAEDRPFPSPAHKPTTTITTTITPASPSDSSNSLPSLPTLSPTNLPATRNRKVSTSIESGTVANIRSKFKEFQHNRQMRLSKQFTGEQLSQGLAAARSEQTSSSPVLVINSPSTDGKRDFNQLSDFEFVRLFKMTKTQFEVLPKPKADLLKKQAGFL
eukprot:TRINITY_DN7924_c0_g1_i1.p1 TRINITY_DN7924_c0_g1~~TRINITY_DN7924_c0_g1_i1.p1  ORF type:complete len:1635 (+),score=514.60 TRINITY_DN7924_c0_g1_i1:40-4944(+)